AEGVDEEAFLRTLNVEASIWRARGEDLARASELLSRTTQFNTTGWRAALAELEALQRRPGTDVFVMAVRDRYADHGVVGVCVIRDRTVEALAVSCRVLTLDVALPFLLTCLSESCAGRGPVTARLVRTERNGPAQDIFLRAGFAETGTGCFRCSDVQSLALVGGSPHAVRLLEASDV